MPPPTPKGLMMMLKWPNGNSITHSDFLDWLLFKRNRKTSSVTSRVAQNMLIDVLSNPGAHTNGYSICACPLCVLENSGVSECYTGIIHRWNSIPLNDLQERKAMTIFYWISLLAMITLSVVPSFTRTQVHNATLFIDVSTMFGTTTLIL